MLMTRKVPVGLPETPFPQSGRILLQGGCMGVLNSSDTADVQLRLFADGQKSIPMLAFIINADGPAAWYLRQPVVLWINPPPPDNPTDLAALMLNSWPAAGKAVFLETPLVHDKSMTQQYDWKSPAAIAGMDASNYTL
jgi:hypothetical protein